LYSQKTMMPI
jgi:GTPase